MKELISIILTLSTIGSYIHVSERGTNDNSAWEIVILTPFVHACIFRTNPRGHDTRSGNYERIRVFNGRFRRVVRSIKLPATWVHFIIAPKKKTLRKDLSKNSIYIKIKAIANIIIHTFKFIAKQSNLKSKRFLKLITNYLNLKDQNGLLLAFLVNVFYSKCTVSKI